MTMARRKKRDIVAIVAASGVGIRVNRTSVINGRSTGRYLEWLREIFIMNFLVDFFKTLVVVIIMLREIYLCYDIID